MVDSTGTTNGIAHFLRMQRRAQEILEQAVSPDVEANDDLTAISFGIHTVLLATQGDLHADANLIKCLVEQAYVLGFGAGLGQVQGARELEELFGSIVEDAFADGD